MDGEKSMSNMISTTVSDETYRKFDEYCIKNKISKTKQSEKLIESFLRSGIIVENEDKVIILTKLKPKVWAEFERRIKSIDKTKEYAVGMLILKWVQGKVEI